MQVAQDLAAEAIIGENAHEGRRDQGRPVPGPLNTRELDGHRHAVQLHGVVTTEGVERDAYVVRELEIGLEEGHGRAFPASQECLAPTTKRECRALRTVVQERPGWHWNQVVPPGRAVLT